MKINKFILIILTVSVLPITYFEGKTSEAMDLIGVMHHPIEYELQNFDGAPKMIESDPLAHHKNIKVNKPDVSALDDIKDILISIKFWVLTQSHLFDIETPQPDRKKLTDPH